MAVKTYKRDDVITVQHTAGNNVRFLDISMEDAGYLRDDLVLLLGPVKPKEPFKFMTFDEVAATGKRFRHIHWKDGWVQVRDGSLFNNQGEPVIRMGKMSMKKEWEIIE